MSSFTPRRRVALALAGFPFLIQIPFGIPAARFDYPDVLRLGADKLLPAFHAGGAPLVATWYAYALAILPFMIAIMALPAALERFRFVPDRLTAIAGHDLL